MASTFADFIQSPQFTFLIGEEETPIVVHAAAIAATSRQLDALINGGMEESKNRCAKFEDISVDDFIRFCEYAYRGDYTVPPCDEIPPIVDSPGGRSGQGNMNGESDDDDEEKVEIVEEQIKAYPFQLAAPSNKKNWMEPVPFPSRSPRPTARSELRKEIYDPDYLKQCYVRTKILQTFEPKPNNTKNQNFTRPLQALTLHKLQKTLMDFKLYTQRIGDVLELARYAYSNPDLPVRGDDGKIDALKELVVGYIVCEIDTIGHHESFVKYMEEGGEFLGDFWRLLRRCIS